MSKYRLTNHLYVVAIPAKEGSLFLGIPDIVYRESILGSFRMDPRLLLAGMTEGERDPC